MLGSVTSNSLKGSIVSSERDVESDDSLASLDKLKVLWVDTSLLSSGVVEKFDLLEETWLVVLVKLWSEFLLISGKSCSGSAEEGWLGSLSDLGKSLHG